MKNDPFKQDPTPIVMKNDREATYEDIKSEFEQVLAKAKTRIGNQPYQAPRKSNSPSYQMIDGIPHKLKDGQWVPLKKL